MLPVCSLLSHIYKSQFTFKKLSSGSSVSLCVVLIVNFQVNCLALIMSSSCECCAVRCTVRGTKFLFYVFFKAMKRKKKFDHVFVVHFFFWRLLLKFSVFIYWLRWQQTLVLLLLLFSMDLAKHISKLTFNVDLTIWSTVPSVVIEQRIIIIERFLWKEQKKPSPLRRFARVFLFISSTAATCSASFQHRFGFIFTYTLKLFSVSVGFFSFVCSTTSTCADKIKTKPKFIL